MIFIQEAGECCGFSAWQKSVNDEVVFWENNICGKGVMSSGLFSLAEYEAAKEKVKTSPFDEWGEAVAQINDEVEIFVDKCEIECGFEIFNLRVI